MTKCPICNRDPRSLGGFDCAVWCKDCSDEYYETTKQKTFSIAEWAANRAREFERDRAKVLVEALEEITNMEHANKSCSGEGYFYYCVEVAQEALKEYKKE